MQKYNKSQPNESNNQPYNERLFSHLLNPTNVDNNAAKVSPLHSLANVAAEQSNWYSLNGNNTAINSVTIKNGTQITNVWIPPRIEQVEVNN